MKQINLHLPTRLCATLLVALAALLAAPSAAAYDFMVDGICYNINSDGESVTVTYERYANPRYTNASGSLTIPSSVTYNGNDYDVTAIGDYAFCGCSGFDGTLTLSESLTAIGDYAFYGCSGFDGTLTLSESLTTIGKFAFEGCSGFTGSLSIPNSVITINESAFGGCSGFIGTLTLPNSLISIGNIAFHSCSGFTGSLTIPCAVTSIGSSAFIGCSGFTGTLTIGNSVTTIGTRAFYGCSGFTGLFWNATECSNFPADSSYHPFKGLTNLMNVSVGNQVRKISANFLSRVVKTTCGSLTIPDSVTTIGYHAFYDCSGFTGSLTIGNSVTNIGISAFYGCSGINKIVFNAVNCCDLGPDSVFRNIPCQELTIGEAVQRIPAYFLYNCSSFTGSLTIPNSVTTIGQGAFINCSGFTGSLNIPNSVTNIGGNAFRNCSGFTGSLFIPESVTSIGGSAFGNCVGLETLVVSENNPKYDSRDNCNSVIETATNILICGIKSFRIPNTVTAIYTRAFFLCSEYTGSLIIPESVTIIGSEAFMSCRGFTGSLVIPSSITSIGQYAFESCNGFSEIYSNIENPETVSYGGRIFNSIPSTIPVYVPCGTLAEYQATAPWSSFTNIIEQCEAATYAVNIAPAEHGTVTADVEEAAEGDVVTLTVAADELFELKSLMVTDDGGNAVEQTAAGDGTWTFTMPASDVTVTATFELVPWLRYDVNGDGAVDVRDINEIINYILGR